MNSEIEKAAEVVKNGGVILYPTETVWGLGCDPNNDNALKKIAEIKKRSGTKSLILLVHNESLLSRYVKEIPEVCYDLLDSAVTPLTIIYPNGQYVSKDILAEDGSIAIRVTMNDFCKGLTAKLKSAIVSTSANLAGHQPSAKLEEIVDEIKDQVDYIVAIKQNDFSSRPSQIIKIKANSEVEIIRK